PESITTFQAEPATAVVMDSRLLAEPVIGPATSGRTRWFGPGMTEREPKPMADEQMDQDSLVAEWGVALEAEQKAAVKIPGDGASAGAEVGAGVEAMAAQWANIADDGNFSQGAKGGSERILTQEEIDSLLGFSLADVSLNDNSGIRAIINSAMVSYERLPMLEIIFDRLVRLMTTSLRNFTSDNVEVSLDRITSVRFGDYLN